MTDPMHAIVADALHAHGWRPHVMEGARGVVYWIKGDTPPLPIQRAVAIELELESRSNHDAARRE
jgi:hypothetical protein